MGCRSTRWRERRVKNEHVNLAEALMRVDRAPNADLAKRRSRRDGGLRLVSNQNQSERRI